MTKQLPFPKAHWLLVVCVITVIASCSRKSDSDSSAVALMPLSSPANSVAGEPYLLTDKNGKVYMSWVAEENNTSVFKFSSYENGQWSAPQMIDSSSSWFVNWADYPMITTDGAGNFLAHVLSKSGEGAFSYDVKMYMSDNGGQSWDTAFVVHEDGMKAEHGFVTLLPYEGNYFVTWLDGRNTVMEGMPEMDHGGHHGAMSLRAAILSPAGAKLQEWELDLKTCDCCQTTGVITENGPVVIYRDRTDEEIRDISIVRLVDGSWTEPKPIYVDGWNIAGCPVNGPRSDTFGSVMAVAWFTAANNEPKVNLAFSDDGGNTFNEPIRIDGGKPLGRVDMVLLDEQRAVVSWMEGDEIRASIMDRNGNTIDSFLVAKSSGSRASGFPQMTKSGDELIFAWTDNAEKSVKTAKVSL